MNALLQKFDDLLNDVPAVTPENLEAREQMLDKARRLTISLERPDNSVDRIAFGIWEGISIRIAVDIGLLKHLHHKSPQNVVELSKLTGMDPILLRRLLCCLTSYFVLDQVGDSKFSATEYSKTFSGSIHEPTIIGAHGFLMPGWLATPDFLKANGYQNPTSGSRTAFAKAYGRPEGATVWELLRESPYLDAMGGLMNSYHKGHKSWMDVYPIQERLLEGACKGDGDVLMVDVGGGLGQQATAFAKRHPDGPGRVIVQDLPHALPEIPPCQVELQPHDFLTPQAVKDTCATILKNLASAMEPGYSKVIINEWVVPDVAPSRYMTSADWNMMSFGGGMERSEAMHRQYIEAAGLQIAGIWAPGDKFSESVIEVELV